MAEAIRLGGILATLMPDEPEVLGLEALLCLQARATAPAYRLHGALVLLDDQDRSLWDHDLIARGLALLDRALAYRVPGPYQLQAAIAALHARAERAEDTDWAQIALLYAELARLHPSPVVELNRAVAVAMADGPAAGPGAAGRAAARGATTSTTPPGPTCCAARAARTSRGAPTGARGSSRRTTASAPSSNAAWPSWRGSVRPPP